MSGKENALVVVWVIGALNFSKEYEDSAYLTCSRTFRR